nr:hypothetical protein [Tanacetum cinerariifolium]
MYDETANFITLKIWNDGSATEWKTLYVQWKDDYDANSYDDEEYKGYTENQLAFCDTFDIRLCRKNRRTSFGFHPFQFSSPPRKLTMEEMLYKFIDEGRREHEEMGHSLENSKQPKKLLLKERNNSLSELKFEVHGLSKAINDAQLLNYKVKGVTTRGGKTTTEIIRGTNDKEPLMLHHKLAEPNEVLDETKPQETKDQIVKPPTSLITFPHMLKNEKEEAQQRKFLENLKQLHINIPFTKALS